MDDRSLRVEPPDLVVLLLGEGEHEIGAVVRAGRTDTAGAARVDLTVGIHRLARQRHRVDTGRALEQRACLLAVEHEHQPVWDALSVLRECLGVREHAVVEIDVDVLRALAGQKRLAAVARHGSRSGPGGDKRRDSPRTPASIADAGFMPLAVRDCRMLDDLLGRSALREEITALEQQLEDCETERDRLEEQLEATERRRKDAATELQEAQRRANKLEDRVAQLEDTVERLEQDDTTLSVRGETTLRGGRLREVLDRLESFETAREGALTAYVPDGRDLPREVREAFGERAVLVSRSAPCLALTDDAGLVAACLRPPVEPESFVEWAETFRIEREWFEPRGQYTLALVRSGLFAMGSYEGRERTAFHGFDSELRSQHSKGGFSQSRFERLRDEQIDSHLERCRTALEQRETDRLYVVGERSVLGEFMGRADESSAVDATGEPEAALEDAWQEFFAVNCRLV